jgi:hypothetical protein
MAKSDRFVQMEGRLSDLRTHFLPTTFSLIGQYSARDLDQARGFVVLAHAEVESYFEDRAREKLDEAEKEWKSKRRCTPLMTRLLNYHCARSAKGDGWSPSLPTDESVGRAVNFYSSELSQNHGIKEKNILSMLLPIGIEHDAINATLLGTLDSFGGTRGRVAHLSIKAHQAIDPKTVSDVVGNVMPDLERLDENINALS